MGIIRNRKMRLIDADRLVSHLADWQVQEAPNGWEIIEEAIRAVNEATTIDPVRRGKWIVHGEPPWYVLECSECGAAWHTSGSWDANNYCGNCGAKMEGKE